MKITREFLSCFIIKIVSTCHVPVVEKAADLSNQIFPGHFVTSVVWSGNHNDAIETFLKRFQGAVVLTNLINDSTDTVKTIAKRKGYQQTVFLATKPDELVYFMEILKKSLVTPIQLILALTKFVPEKDLTDLVRSAWENDFANILIVSPTEKCELEIRTFFPYSEGTCNNFTLVTLDDKINNFPKKFTDFHGCEVRATLIEMTPYNSIKFENEDNNTVASISGIDADTFTLLFQVVNAEVKYVSAREQGSMGIIINGTLTGCLGELINATADVFCPAAIINAERYPLFQITHVLQTANIFWFGPRRREISEWIRVLQPFMTQITPALLVSFLLFIVTVMVVRRFGFHRSNSKESALFQSFVVFMGQILKLENQSWLINGLFQMWIWFCLVVRIAYQCDLMDSMGKTILEYPLGSFTEALKQVDGYGGVFNFRNYISGTPYYKDYEVLQFLDVPQYLRDMALGKRYLILTDLLVGFNASQHVQLVGKDPVTQAPATFYMRPGWPPAEEIDIVLFRLIESGFIDKIHNNYRKNRRYWKNDINRDARPLTMSTLIGCFYALGAMYLTSFFVFCSEIIYYKRFGQKKNNAQHNRKRNNRL